MDNLEYGIIVGHLVAEYEKDRTITFTEGFDYDVEFPDLAKQLINEFGQPENSRYGYFSEFVRARLLELEAEKKNDK